jgi:hypothetical protein
VKHKGENTIEDKEKNAISNNLSSDYLIKLGIKYKKDIDVIKKKILDIIKIFNTSYDQIMLKKIFDRVSYLLSTNNINDVDRVNIVCAYIEYVYKNMSEMKIIVNIFDMFHLTESSSTIDVNQINLNISKSSEIEGTYTTDYNSINVNKTLEHNSINANESLEHNFVNPNETFEYNPINANETLEYNPTEGFCISPNIVHQISNPDEQLNTHINNTSYYNQLMQHFDNNTNNISSENYNNSVENINDITLLKKFFCDEELPLHLYLYLGAKFGHKIKDIQSDIINMNKNIIIDFISNYQKIDLLIISKIISIIDEYDTDIIHLIKIMFNTNRNTHVRYEQTQIRII